MNVIPQAVRDGFVRLLEPLARALVHARVTPNVLTTAGALVMIASALSFGFGAVRWGGALLLFSGLFDLLDGLVARNGGTATSFGAFYDSTLDRVGETAVFLAVSLWFLHGGVPAQRRELAVGLAIAALASSLLVSYTRARAQGVGAEAKVGIAQRAERVVLLGVPTLFFGAGRQGALLFWIVAVLAAATSVTVVQRVVYVARTTRDHTRRTTPRRRDTMGGPAAVLRKGH